VRSTLLKEMPTLDDTDVTVRQVGDKSRGMQIHNTDATDSHGGSSATSGSDKGKEKEVPIGPAPKARPRTPPKDFGGSSNPTAPFKKKRRLIHSDKTSIEEPPSVGQQAPSKATAGQVCGSNGNGLGAAHVDIKKPSAATPCIMEGLIKLIKLQLSPNARLNQDTKVWNQIQRQRFKISSSV
jgi:hypothetical protein